MDPLGLRESPIISHSPMSFSMATPTRLLPKPVDLEITIVSAKHLKNVNWRNGDLTPYVIFWVDPDRRIVTKSDDSNSTKPVWNERFVIPLPATPSAAVLTLEIFHSKPSDTPKPLIGAVQISLADLPDPDNPYRIRTFDLRRPSGRVNGKIRLKLNLRERPLVDYQNTPHPQFYYTNTPPPSYGRMPLTPSPYESYASLPVPAIPPAAAALPSPYQYVSQPEPYPVPAIERQFSYVGGPSAPMEYGQYDKITRTGKVGSGSGLGAGGGITRGVAGLAIDDGLRYEDGKISERFEADIGGKKPENYTYYRRVDY